MSMRTKIKVEIPASAERLFLMNTSVWYAMAVATIPTNTEPRLIGREIMDAGGMGIVWS